jgi:hypothetical protein
LHAVMEGHFSLFKLAGGYQMKTSKTQSWPATAVAFIMVFLASCGGGSNEASGGAGTLSLALTDAVNDDNYQAVYVTIKEVQVHTPGGAWAAAASPECTYNLLNLVNGTLEQLGVAELPAGDYSQMRLLLGNTPDGRSNLQGNAHPHANYVIDSGGQVHELNVPSEYRSGIKIVYGFSIVTDREVDLILDFDASRSLVIASGTRQWLLKPTIKMLNEKTCSVIEGEVVDEGGKYLEGASVSAQASNPHASDQRHKVVVEASTVTSKDGQFKLLVSPGTYNVVAYKDNFDLDWECAVAALSGQTQVGTFTLPSLEQTEMGRVSGTVTMAGGQLEQSVTLSFRETGLCDDSKVDLVLKSVNIPNRGTYNERLPEGTYEVVFSSDNNTLSVPSSVDIVGGETVHLNHDM